MFLVTRLGFRVGELRFLVGGGTPTKGKNYSKFYLKTSFRPSPRAEKSLQNG